jgi:hypothetical protein
VIPIFMDFARAALEAGLEAGKRLDQIVDAGRTPGH